jgi:hypothetical protein
LGVTFWQRHQKAASSAINSPGAPGIASPLKVNGSLEQRLPMVFLLFPPTLEIARQSNKGFETVGHNT